MLGSLAALLLLLPFACASEIALNPPVFVLQNDDGSINLNNLVAVERQVKMKYTVNTENVVRYKHAKGLSAYRQRKRADVSLALQRYSVWTGSISVGRHGQNFSIYFDTGSTDFTLADASCSVDMCGTKNRYNPSISKTAKSTGRQATSQFADGTSSVGTLYRDFVSAAGLFDKMTAVVSATSLSSTVAALPADGMGLAYASLSATFSESLPFRLFKMGRKVTSFSVRLSDTAGKAVLSFGPPDSSRYQGALTYLPVAKSGGSNIYSYWQLGGSVIAANGQTASTAANAIIDSGTTLIIGTPQAAAAFYSKIPGSAPLPGDSTHWTFPCASQPVVSFTFGGSDTPFSVAPQDFNLGYLQEDPSKCVGAVVGQSLGLGTSWVLGASFMKNWYTVFDMENNAIGLATPR